MANSGFADRRPFEIAADQGAKDSSDPFRIVGWAIAAGVTPSNSSGS